MSYQKRACIRIPTSFKAVLVTPEGERHSVNVINMSVTGFQLSCQQLFSKNDSFVLQICLPKKTENFELEVKTLRARNLSEERSDFTCSLGMIIINPPENWEPHAGQWIQSQLGSQSKRQIACGLLLFTAFIFAVKTTLTTLGLQTLELPLNDFIGLTPLEFPILGKIFIFAGMLLAALMIFCGLQILRPSIREGLFFTSTAAIGGMICFAPRLLLKLSLLQNSNEQKLFYLFEFFVFMLGLAGAIWARRLEDRHQHLVYILERENIFPPVQKPAKT